MSVNDHLEKLLSVQRVDMRLVELEQRQGNVPIRRAEVAREITALEDEQSQLEELNERARLSRRQLEGDLETEQEKLSRYEEQLNQVKTNVAYSALLTEIQTAKKAIGELEEGILALMEEREGHEARLGEIVTELGAKRAAAAEELNALDEEGAAVERDLETARAERAALVERVDRDLLGMYERICRARRFPALVPLHGSACGGCFGHLPPEVMRQITHDGMLHRCENCGLLVYDPGEGVESAEGTPPPVGDG